MLLLLLLPLSCWVLFVSVGIGTVVVLPSLFPLLSLYVLQWLLHQLRRGRQSTTPTTIAWITTIATRTTTKMSSILHNNTYHKGMAVHLVYLVYKRFDTCLSWFENQQEAKAEQKFGIHHEYVRRMSCLCVNYGCIYSGYGTLSDKVTCLRDMTKQFQL